MSLCEFQVLLNYVNEEKYWFLQAITNISGQVFIAVVEVVVWISILAMGFLMEMVGKIKFSAIISLWQTIQLPEILLMWYYLSSLLNIVIFVVLLAFLYNIYVMHLCKRF